MTSPQTTDPQHQQALQQALTATLATSMATAWGVLNVADLAGSLPKYQAAVAALVYKYGQTSATLTARYYTAARLHAGVAGRFRPTAAQPAGISQVSDGLGWATKGLWAAQPDVPAAKTLANGVAQKLVVGTGRNTLIAAIGGDKQCRGWAREARPSACSFCALLSTRGAVYKSEKTASVTKDGAAYHDHCHCLPVPLFADHYEPPAHVREWAQLYRDTPYGKDAAEARNNFRVALAKHRAAVPALV